VGLQSFQSYRHIPFDHLTTQAGGAWGNEIMQEYLKSEKRKIC
jgi:hypothetical protein